MERLCNRFGRDVEEKMGLMSFLPQPGLRFGRYAVRRGLTAGLSAALLLAGCRAEQPWPLWNSYASVYLDDQGRVIDHTAADHSTTEGEAYAMFFALVVNDRPRFDKLVNWTEQNMAQGDLTLHLPGWSWGKAADGSWKVLDANSAADADLWMAYSLCEAGRLWHVERYSNLGRLMEERMAREEMALIPSVGVVLLPGKTGFHPTPTTWYVNPSYPAPALVEYFAKLDPMLPWGQVLASLPSVVGSSGGFAMDWMSATADTGMSPSAPPGVVAALPEGQTGPVPVGSYDAIRVYLWAGMADPRTPYVKDEFASLHGMDAYLKTNGTPPLQVGPEGQALNPDGPVGFSAAVIPYLHTLGDKPAAKSQTDRLVALQDSKTGLYGHSGQYYDQNLVMFEDGWAKGLFSFDADGRLHLKWK